MRLAAQSITNSKYSVTVFTGENWYEWKDSLFGKLKAKGVYRMAMEVTGRMPNGGLATTKGDSSVAIAEAKQDAYETANEKAMGILIESLGFKYCPLIRDEELFGKAWSKLSGLYEATSDFIKLRLNMEFNNLDLKVGEFFSDFLTRLEDILQRLKAAGIEKDTKDIAAKLLTLLNARDEFKVLATTLAMSGKALNYEELRSTLIQYDQLNLQTNSTNQSQPKMIMNIITCYNCKKKGHKKQDCRFRGGGAYKKKEFYSSKEKDKENQNEINTVTEKKEKVFILNVSNEPKFSFFLDSGAASHVFSQKIFLSNLRSYPYEEVTTASGEVLKVGGIGSFEFKNKSGQRFRIDDVLWVPGVKKNLISLPQFKRDSILKKIGKTFFISFGQNEKTVVIDGKIDSNNLMKLNIFPTNNVQNVSAHL